MEGTNKTLLAQNATTMFEHLFAVFDPETYFLGGQRPRKEDKEGDKKEDDKKGDKEADEEATPIGIIDKGSFRQYEVALKEAIVAALRSNVLSENAFERLVESLQVFPLVGGPFSFGEDGMPRDPSSNLEYASSWQEEGSSADFKPPARVSSSTALKTSNSGQNLANQSSQSLVSLGQNSAGRKSMKRSMSSGVSKHGLLNAEQLQRISSAGGKDPAVNPMLGRMMQRKKSLEVRLLIGIAIYVALGPLVSLMIVFK
jgi:hypothetical protein